MHSAQNDKHYKERSLTDSTILEVQDLKTYFFTRRGAVKAVDGIDFSLKKGECLCLVGESGCGKSVTVLSLLRLVAAPGRIVSGQVHYNNVDLVHCSEEKLRGIRGGDIAMIFQDAQSAFNPVLTIGDQIAEQMTIHGSIDRQAVKNKGIELLKEMNIPEPDRVWDSFPHQLSGGMKQRAMIAMSLSCDPKILIADEPTTAVDVTIKAQILDILHTLKEKRGMSLIFVTHDLGIVADIGDRAQVIYGGKSIEMASVSEIINNPGHPYTKGLIACLPDSSTDSERLASIPGTAPNPIDLPEGCPFHPRCAQVMDICRHVVPKQTIISETHTVNCHLFG